MANQHHLEVLKPKGQRWPQVHIWNRWILEYYHNDPDGTDCPDLSGTDFAGNDLRSIDFATSNLKRINLSKAHLYHANFHKTDLEEGNLSQANLRWVDLSYAKLARANLTGAILSGTDLTGADLTEADLTEARVSMTIFGDIDLSTVKGLDTIQHEGPSTIGIDTIYRSKGNIPQTFLRGAGTPETFIMNIRALVESMSPIDFYSCFISYSGKDQGFAERLYADLQSKGVRCWYAPHHMKTGDKIRDRIDESIRISDKLLLVLSEYSITSTWVEHEVEAALDKERLAKERHTPQTVLFPITLDDAIMTMESSWPAKVRRERHITDFRQWKQHDTYQQAFEHLLLDLRSKQTPKG